MRERSEEAFFIAKSREADKRATLAADDAERATWREIADEYRRLSHERARPEEKKGEVPSIVVYATAQLGKHARAMMSRVDGVGRYSHHPSGG